MSLGTLALLALLARVLLIAAHLLERWGKARAAAFTWGAAMLAAAKVRDEWR